MTRSDLLRALIRQAKDNDFEFRKWYGSRLALSWTSFEDAIATLAKERRYYCLLFSHEFAQAFWKEGSKITFVVPTSSYTRVTKNNQVITVRRRSHTRRTALPDAWRYHLQQMALAEDPLRYIRRFLSVEEDLLGGEIPSDLDEAGESLALETRLQENPLSADLLASTDLMADMLSEDDIPYFDGTP